MKISFGSAVLAGLSLAALSVGPVSAAELRMATIAPGGHVWLKVAERVNDTLKNRPEADLKINIFPSAQLGQEAETLQQVQAGLIDMTYVTIAGLSVREPAMNGWFTPYLMKDVVHAGKAANTPAAGEMLKRLERQGMVGLGYVFAGMRQILTRDQPATGAADLARKKIRITPFPAARTWWEAMGAVPTPIPLSNVYQSLQTGVVDGVDIDLDAMAVLKLQEVGKGLTLSQHMSWPGAILMSKTSWDKLKPEQKKILQDAITEATAWGVKAQAEAEVNNLEKVSKDVKVARLQNGEEAFAVANAAFAKAYGADPLIKSFQDQVKAAK